MKYIFCCLMLMMVLPVNATTLTGSDFLDMCDLAKEEKVYPEKCTAYVSGVYEAYVAFNTWGLVADTLCLPDDIDVTSVTTTAINYVESMQDHAAKTASSMVLNAMADTYPCE